jgi:PKD repeat protein
MKKKMILILVLWCFLGAAFETVCAVDVSETLTDEVGDVIEISDTGSDSVSRPNVDIWQVSYTKTGSEIEIQLQLAENGKIKGVAESQFFEYDLALLTSESQYDIYYFNGECTVNDDTADCSGAGTDTLTVTFDLGSSDEEIRSIQAFAFEISTDGYFIDQFPDLYVDAEFPFTAETGESISFTGEAVGGVPPYIWLWDFGDGTTSDEQNTTHIYHEAGTFEVVLTVIDSVEIGNIFSDTIIISANQTDNGGDNQQNDGDDDSGLMLFIGIIVIISIIGVIAIVYIIRR